MKHIEAENKSIKNSSKFIAHIEKKLDVNFSNFDSNHKLKKSYIIKA